MREAMAEAGDPFPLSPRGPNARATLTGMGPTPTTTLRDLNPAQAEAVTYGDGALLILAGPGSGKTRVLAHRIAYLVRERGIAPRQILAVTFTNKAAREMRDRVTALLEQEAGAVTAGTFHAVCARLLRRDGGAIGIARGFAIFDAADQLAIVKRVLADFAVDPKAFPPAAILQRLSRAKNERMGVEQFRAHAGNYFEEVVARVYERYQSVLSDNQALDFDDLLFRTLDLFQDVPAVRERYQEQFHQVLVDEFQDTNVVQYQLAREWSGRWGNLAVVGDPDQSIYSWRAADIRNILHFQRDYPHAALVRLEQNYRSTQSILRVADAVIEKATQRLHKALWTENERGRPPVVYEAYTEADEAQFIVEEIGRQIGGGRWTSGEVAVMYRTNAQSRVLEEAFLRAGLPYRLVGATRFYERREIKDLLAYLRLVLNPADSVAFQRVLNVPGRGLGQRSREAILQWATERGVAPLHAIDALGRVDGPQPPPRAAAALRAFRELIDQAALVAVQGTVKDLLGFLLRETGYQDYLFAEFEDAEERWQNVQELRTVAANYEALSPDTALAAFLEDVALVSDIDGLPDGPTAATTLITLHAAKGLEFPVVFLAGLEEGVLPHLRSFDDPAALEEERRLCYVGVTRAKRELYLLYAFRRALAGSAGHNPPSRFLGDLPADAVEFRGRAVGLGARRPTAPPPRRYAWAEADGIDPEPLELPELEPGDRVRHRSFGEGGVVACQAIRGDYEITVHFDTAGTKKLLLSLALLEKI